MSFGSIFAYDKDIETILDERMVCKWNYNLSHDYLVRWKGSTDCETC